MSDDKMLREAGFPPMYDMDGPFQGGGHDRTDYYRIGPTGTDEMICDVAGKENAELVVAALNAYSPKREMLRRFAREASQRHARVPDHVFRSTMPVSGSASGSVGSNS